MQAAGLRVFVPQRDLCAGTIEHASSAKIIEERCDKVVTIFSPSFFESSTNRFNTSFALYAGIKVGTQIFCSILVRSLNGPTFAFFFFLKIRPVLVLGLSVRFKPEVYPKSAPISVPQKCSPEVQPRSKLMKCPEQEQLK